MSVHLWTVVFWGTIVLLVVLFGSLQRWTAAKQQQLSAEEFRRRFQKNYLGVTAEAGSAAELDPGGGTNRTRKASAAINQNKPAS